MLCQEHDIVIDCLPIVLKSIVTDYLKLTKTQHMERLFRSISFNWKIVNKNPDLDFHVTIRQCEGQWSHLMMYEPFIERSLEQLRHLVQKGQDVILSTFALGVPGRMHEFEPLAETLMAQDKLNKWIDGQLLVDGVFFQTKIKFTKESSLNRFTKKSKTLLILQIQFGKSWFRYRSEMDVIKRM